MYTYICICTYIFECTHICAVAKTNATIKFPVPYMVLCLHIHICNPQIRICIHFCVRATCKDSQKRHRFQYLATCMVLCLCVCMCKHMHSENTYDDILGTLPVRMYGYVWVCNVRSSVYVRACECVVGLFACMCGSMCGSMMCLCEFTCEFVMCQCAFMCERAWGARQNSKMHASTIVRMWKREVASESARVCAMQPQKITVVNQTLNLKL